MAQATACCLPCSIATHWLIGWPALLEDAGHPFIQAAILGTADCLGAFAQAITVHVMPPTLVRYSRSTPAAIPAHPAPLAPATSPTGTAPAAFLSSSANRHGPLPGTPRRRAEPVQASPGHNLVSHTHQAGPARLAAGHLAATRLHWVSLGSTAAGRSPARG